MTERSADTDAVRVLDLEGQYHGTPVDRPADPDLYERVIEGFPDALIDTDGQKNVNTTHDNRAVRRTERRFS